MTYRLEADFVGEKQVPKDAYYGVQSLRRSKRISPSPGKPCVLNLLNPWLRLKSSIINAT